MNLTPGSTQNGFTVEAHEELVEINGTATVMRHTSGARLLYLANEDNDKAFSISFKTPPANDTGVFHILEHSVLCGSRKFPVKEPFVNLLKSSMQTFLNAMTYPDKTVYPVSSTNEKDLMNLMDVYLDAVLHPAIYSREAIFKQEGWHFELDGLEAPLTYNGVVYNEMKGVMSDPESVLYDALQAELFPDTAYRFESGGMPRAIPDLTYADFLDNHSRHYRLDNSYITLYGNLDIDAMLAFLDENYLGEGAGAGAVCGSGEGAGAVGTVREGKEGSGGSAAKAPGSPNPLAFQSPTISENNVIEMATSPENACAALGYVVGTYADHEKLTGLSILMDALMGSNEAPLKKALLEAGFAGDVYEHMNKSILQPFIMIEAKGLKPKMGAEFKRAFEDSVRALVEKGIDKQLIEGAIAHAEFTMREGDFSTSTGVLVSVSALSGWLYDDALAIEPIRYEACFAHLREMLKTRYFEELLEEVFLNNQHRAFVEVVPTTKESSEEAERLAAIKSTLDTPALEAIMAEAEELKRIQMEPDSPEALASLPLLELSDIAEAPAEPDWRVLTDTQQACITHDVHTHGIDYLRFYFPLDGVAYEDLPYLSLLSRLLGNLDTNRYTAAEIDTQSLLYLGRLRFSTSVFENEGASQGIAPYFVVSTSCLSKNLKHAIDIPTEIWAHTKFNDPERIKTILTQAKIGYEQVFSNSGHTSAMGRLASHLSFAGKLMGQLSGVNFYYFLRDLLENFDERIVEVIAKLEDLTKRIFTTSMTLSFAGVPEDLDRVWELGGSFELQSAEGTGARGENAAGGEGATGAQSTAGGEGAGSDSSAVSPERTLVVPDPEPKNEAFIVPTDVCFVAAGTTRQAIDGLPYGGEVNIATRALSYDYLWNEVRVKGGAYGAGYRTMRTGNIMFYSFRDPNLDATVATYNAAGSWLADYEPTETELRGYIISAVASFDAPCKPRALSQRQDSRYFAGLPENWREQMRSEMLACTAEDLQARGKALETLAQHEIICVFGNKEKIETSSLDLAITELY